MYADTRFEPKIDQAVEEKTPGQLILLEAARILERDGWCQGNLHRDGRHCIMGAIQRALTDNPNIDKIFDAAIPRICREIGDFSVAMWNDMHGRTQAEAIEMLRAAAV